MVRLADARARLEGHRADIIDGRDRSLLAESDPAITFLCSPNNPTGTALTREEIARVHDETDALILLDQAYVEFGGYDGVPLLGGRPRLVVLRTFSKAMAMAGLRAGYMLADPALTAEVNKAKLPYNVNFFTECAAAEVLRCRNELAPLVAAIAAERDRLAAELGTIPGLRVYPSAANFILFRVEAPGITHTAVFERLLRDDGVLVRDESQTTRELYDRFRRVEPVVIEALLDPAFDGGALAVRQRRVGRDPPRRCCGGGRPTSCTTRGRPRTVDGPGSSA